MTFWNKPLSVILKSAIRSMNDGKFSEQDFADMLNDEAVHTGGPGKKKKRKKLPSIKAAMTWATDWSEDQHTHSFDDIHEAVSLAVANKFPIGDGEHQHSGYFVFKLWQDKVVVKRSFFNENEDDALFLRMSYLSENTPDVGLTITLAEPSPVKLAFVPLSMEPSDTMLMAAREVDLLGFDEELLSEATFTTKPWNGSRGRFTLEQLLRSVPSAIAANARKVKGKDLVKTDAILALPFKEPTGTVNVNGVRAALAALGGARGAKLPGIPADVKASARKQLTGLLNEFRRGQAEAASEILAVDPEIEDYGDDLETGVKESSTIELDETFSSPPLVDAVVDKDNLIIRGVKMLGPISANNRTYPVETQQAALPLLEGVKAFLDHPTEADKNEPRQVRDLIGQHKNVRVEGDSTFSDLHLVNTALVKDIVLPIAESNPSLIGNSIVARGVMNEKNVVIEITAVRSVDLVAEPATTKGLFEGNKAFKKEPTQKKGDEIMSTKEEVLKDNKLSAELKAHFQEGFKADMEKSKEWNELKAQVESAKADTKEAQTKLLAKETAEAKTEEGRKIATMIADSKLPEEIKKGDKLRGLLEDAKDEEARKAIIQFMEEAAEKGVISDPSLNHEKVIGTDGQINEGTYAKAFNALGSNRSSL